MKYRTVFTHDPFGPEDNELLENSKDIVLRDMLQYPNSSILHKDIYEKLLNNLDKIPIQELDEFLNQYNCI